jgi:serine/threonine-protein kinase
MVRLNKEFLEAVETSVGISTGDLLGEQYEVGELLGRGGMGAVYRAQDTLLDRPVALKVLPAFLGDSRRAREGLRKEAARAIELAHPALARIYHFGLHREQPFLVMEFIEGQTLADLLDARGPLSLERTRKILRPLAEALDYAHARKLVHRDVKPANILLRKGSEEPILIDFGIAGEVRDQSTRSGHTAIGATTGTLSYMSPEQVQGKPPHPGMDRYALAAVAYEMLGGDPPFFRGDPLNVQYQIVHEPPPRLKPLEPTLMTALERGLAKREEDRFATSVDLVLALGGEAPDASAALVRTPGSFPPETSDAAATLVPPSQTPPLAPAEETDENLRVHLLLGSILGLVCGYVSAFLAVGAWNVLAVPALQELPQDQVREALQNPWGLFLANFLPPVVMGAFPFALITGFFSRWLEERRSLAGLPFLLGVGVGVFLATYTVLLFLPQPATGQLPMASIGLILAGLLAMALMIGIGLVLLPDCEGLEEEDVGAAAWWGGRLALVVLLPFFVGLTGLVIGQAMPWQGYLLLLDSLQSGRQEHLLFPFVVHFLPWVTLITPALTLLAKEGGSYMEKKFRGTGGPLVVGLALSLATNGLLCWHLGWFTAPPPHAEAWKLLGSAGITFFRTSVFLALGIGCVQILWAGREQVFATRNPPWLFTMVVAGTRSACDVVVYFLGLELFRGAFFLQHFLQGFPALGKALSLAVPFLLYGLATTSLLAHLFRPTPPAEDATRGNQIVAGSFLVSPLLLWLLIRTDPTATVTQGFWQPLWYAALLATLPGIWLGRRGNLSPIQGEEETPGGAPVATSVAGRDSPPPGSKMASTSGTSSTS